MDRTQLNHFTNKFLLQI